MMIVWTNVVFGQIRHYPIVEEVGGPFGGEEAAAARAEAVAAGQTSHRREFCHCADALSLRRC